MQAYLASTAYVDAEVGVVLDALEKSPFRPNTIVVILLKPTTRLRRSVSARTCCRKRRGATHMGSRPERPPAAPVEFLSIYPTLCDLTGLPKTGLLEGRQHVPLLVNSQAKDHAPRPTTSTTTRCRSGEVSLHQDGDEELYDEKADPVTNGTESGRETRVRALKSRPRALDAHGKQTR